jgi:YHS domain-containing protein
MELRILEADHTHIRAGYSCPCGCTPSVALARGSQHATDGCCCGNQFAVGPRATEALAPVPDFRTEVQSFDAPWGERLEAAWLIGPSTHEAAQDGHHHGQEHGHDGHHLHVADASGAALDPVCGMTVDPEGAVAKGLHSTYRSRDFYFCGKGCKLDFDEDPDHYLDPNYVASM